MSDTATTERPKEIGLTEFMKEMIDEVAGFFDYWVERMVEEPDTFPDRMPPGEWDEQFRAWCDLRRGG